VAKRKVTAYNRFFAAKRKQGKSPKQVGVLWRKKKAGKPITRRTKRKVTKRAVSRVRKTQKRVVRKIKRRKSKVAKRKNKRRSVSRKQVIGGGLLGTAALVGIGTVAASGIQDYAVTGKLPTFSTLSDRAQGIIGKLGQKEVLYPLVVGAVVLPTLKLTGIGITKRRAGIIGGAMVASSLYAAAVTPGSPGTPIGQTRTVAPRVNVVSSSGVSRRRI